MPEYRTLIVEDEYWLARELKRLVHKHPAFEVIDIVDNGQQALNLIKQQQPDLVLLDIMMPGLSGIQVVQQLPAELVPHIIFVTAFDNYAIKAFELNAVDYLLKPVSQERLHDALQRVQSRLEAGLPNAAQTHEVVSNAFSAAALQHVADERKIVVNKTTSSAPFELVISTIVWVDAAGDYMCIYTSHDTFILRSTMKQLLHQLGDEQFTRIHRSSLINLAMVDKFSSLGKGDYQAHLFNGEVLKVSRSYAEKVLTAHHQFLSARTSPT